MTTELKRHYLKRLRLRYHRSKKGQTMTIFKFAGVQIQLMEIQTTKQLSKDEKQSIFRFQN